MHFIFTITSETQKYTLYGQNSPGTFSYIDEYLEKYLTNFTGISGILKNMIDIFFKEILVTRATTGLTTN